MSTLHCDIPEKDCLSDCCYEDHKYGKNTETFVVLRWAGATQRWYIAQPFAWCIQALVFIKRLDHSNLMGNLSLVLLAVVEDISSGHKFQLFTISLCR